MTEPLIEKVKNGICPFTAQRYDCARCDLDPESTPITSNDFPGMTELHMSFCITRFATGQTDKREMRRIAKGFISEDGTNPTVDYLLDYFRTLYSLGVELIPMCSCDRFCFKHGCKGRSEK